ncbi:DUF2232 domain-containing protein [Methylopila sp. M107]|uniref:DUF2232 domain-containing protein n=1 Tax=Methylopila sp. M107 TaxID=1101190 RepID=UPI00036702F8|nr:DUF2232 domain-containing protein [Methylopila sp. M107]
MNASLLLIGFGAGAASALMFAAVQSGSPLALLMLYAAPLPILIAGVGWRHVAGLVGVGVGALILALAVSPLRGLVFAVAVGLPAWWLAYLALLARPGDAPDQTQWYPVGRLVVWCAAIGAGLVCLSIPLISTDLATYRGVLSGTFAKAFDMLIASGSGPALPPGFDAKILADFVAATLPIVGAMLGMAFLLFNLWIAARVCRASGRLVRPWPELARFELPRGAGLGLLAGVAGSLLPGVASLVAELFAATLLVAFMLLGLAVLHVATLASPARGLILFAIYAVLLMIPAIPVFLAALGVAEQLFGLRRRFGPPPGGPPMAAANQP